MLLEVVRKYFPKSHIIEILPYGNGHINDTYILKMEDIPQNYILQKLNTDVFPNPQKIIETHLRLQNYFSAQKPLVKIAQIIPNAQGDFLTIDSINNAWRLTEFIDNTYTIDKVAEFWQTYEAGKAYGGFARACSKLNVLDFTESIKNFHRLSFRLKQLDKAIENNSANRLDTVLEYVSFFEDRKNKLNLNELLVDEGRIPLRVVHNDTKINNLLYKDRKAEALIDLDTVGPGILWSQSSMSGKPSSQPWKWEKCL